MMINKKKVIGLTILIFIVAGAFLWIRSYTFSNIGASINKKIQSLNLSGFNVRYDSLSIDWRENEVEITNLLLEKNPYDTVCIYPEFIKVGKIRAAGFRLFPLIFRNILSFEDLYLGDLRVMMRQNSQLKLDSASQRENQFSLRVDHIFLESADFKYTDSARCEMINGFNTDLTVSGLSMEFYVEKPLSYEVDWFKLDSTTVQLPDQYYTFHIKRALMDFSEQAFDIDSLQVIPDLGKVEFGNKTGFEIDRFEGMIPYIKLRDFNFSFIDSTRITSSMAEVQFYLRLFRDKRLPIKKTTKLLPMDQIANLPFGLTIDSLKVIKSYVSYEEFAEGATESGEVYFDNIYAVLSSIGNENRTEDMQLTAQSNLSGDGSLKIHVVFPVDKVKPAQLTGSLQNFDIPKINSMLTPSTNFKVETGQMKNLAFNFSFDRVQSEGQIELNYENLKLISYKDQSKQSGDDPEKNNLKSFIMNTFIFKKNMDENVPEEKRTGAVLYQRDETKSIFNYWVKSLVSGLKSAYNLGNAGTKNPGEETKKEQRLTKREARKLKKGREQG